LNCFDKNGIQSMWIFNCGEKKNPFQFKLDSTVLSENYINFLAYHFIIKNWCLALLKKYHFNSFATKSLASRSIKLYQMKFFQNFCLK